MRVSRSEVASLAGVSDATVSRVINGRRGVSDQTRTAVHEAMERLGFDHRPPSRIVPVVTYPADPLLAAMFEALQVHLALAGLRPVVVPAALEADYLPDLIDLGICAAIFLSAESNTITSSDLSNYRLLESRRLPYVCVNGMVEATAGPGFGTDEVAAAEIAVQHLWDAGHSRIGLIAGPEDNRHAERRTDGFVRRLQLLGVKDPSQHVIRQPFSLEGAQAASEQLLDRGMTAVIASSDLMALGVIRAARRRGVHIPNHLSVIGSNDAPILEFVDPPLTSVRIPAEQIATAAARAIVDMVSGRTIPPAELLFQPDLIIRGSTAPPAGW